MPTFKDLTGERFGRLQVLHLEKTDGRYKYWLCQCDCGNTALVDGDRLRNGSTKSCGCLRRENTIRFNKETKTIHGGRHTKLYGVWIDMRVRCRDKSNERYGGRGIYVCPEWDNTDNGFVNFREWALSNGYEEGQGLTIDRIDNDGPYSPENCRWVDFNVQANNKSTNKHIEYDGKTYTYSQFSKAFGISESTVRNRSFYMTPEEILSTPLKGTYEYQGRCLNLDELSKISGINRDTIYNRIKHGMTAERAITKKHVDKDGNVTIPNAIYFEDENGNIFSQDEWELTHHD